MSYGESKDVECPYCGEWNEICHDDGFGYDEDELHQMECAHCEKQFGFYTSISYCYDGREVPCWNGTPHVWKEDEFDKKHNFKNIRRTCDVCEEREHIPNPDYDPAKD